jgi:hypothetical protein
MLRIQIERLLNASALSRNRPPPDRSPSGSPSLRRAALSHHLLTRCGARRQLALIGRRRAYVIRSSGATTAGTASVARAAVGAPVAAGRDAARTGRPEIRQRGGRRTGTAASAPARPSANAPVSATTDAAVAHRHHFGVPDDQRPPAAAVVDQMLAPFGPADAGRSGSAKITS